MFIKQAHSLYRGLNATTTMNAIRRVPMIDETNLTLGVTSPVMIEYLIPQSKPTPLDNIPITDDPYDPHSKLFKFVNYSLLFLSFFGCLN